MQLFGFKEDAGPVPRGSQGFAFGVYGLRSGDGRLSNSLGAPPALAHFSDTGHMTEPTSKVIPLDRDGVRGFLHTPGERAGRGLVLTHGAGGDCASPLLVKPANAFSLAGFAVLRCDLPFRQKRRSGPPSPAARAADRAGLRAAAALLKELARAKLSWRAFPTAAARQACSRRRRRSSLPPSSCSPIRCTRPENPNACGLSIFRACGRRRCSFKAPPIRSVRSQKCSWRSP